MVARALLALAVAASIVAAEWGRGAVFQACETDDYPWQVASSSKKGLTLDDETLLGCPSRIPELWPNTQERVTSLRLFRVWSKDWPEAKRLPTFEVLRDLARNSFIQILVGTPLTCNAEDDEQDWQWTKELLQMLGPDHVMGLSVGNELELLWKKKREDRTVTKKCIDEFWGDEGYFWQQFQRRVKEFDALGFESAKVTSVFSGAALGGDWRSPFLETKGKAMVNTFFTSANKAYGKRFVFTFNFYPYFDESFGWDPGLGGRAKTCKFSLAAATCWGDGCAAPSGMAVVPRKIQQLTGAMDRVFWVGETGWCSAKAATLHTKVADCKAWSSEESYRSYYEGFLAWDLRINGMPPPEHVFYFTMRDALNYGQPEHFGVIEHCNSTKCKVHSKEYVGPTLEPPPAELSWQKGGLAAIGGIVALAVAGTVAYANTPGGALLRSRARSLGRGDLVEESE
mmetsp:Transcript_109334/g.244290  ORF Transcript_109334/g.244290 Transcript_109334/m.244290 type:complete len:455 (+) Transcript_109334:75-1439(+)